LNAVGTVAVAWCALGLFVGMIDPLGIYAWGIKPQLKAGDDYSLESTPYLAAVVAKNSDFDTLFIGGSTGHFYTPQMMEEILPNTHRAFNLSYGGPSAQDRAAIARQILRYSHAHRVILETDWSYTIPKMDQRMWASFPIYLYDTVWWNDVRAIDLQAVELSLAVLRGDPLWIGEWSQAREQQSYLKRFDLMHTPAALANFKDMVTRYKASIDTPGNFGCQTLNEIGDNLVPFVRALSARGTEVDILIPVYSWTMYYLAQQPDPIEQLPRASFLHDQLLMRRCLVQALDGLPRVHIFAFDDVPGLAADLRNYFDPGHLYNSAANRYILRSIAKGEHRLTHDNIDVENSRMRLDVIGYQFTSDKVWIPPQ
jgi:hypothetical protein